MKDSKNKKLIKFLNVRENKDGSVNAEVETTDEFDQMVAEKLGKEKKDLTDQEVSDFITGLLEEHIKNKEKNEEE